MKKRGQIFSLDFVISMILVVLAIGTAIQYVEIHNYAMKDAELMRELEWIALGASDVLVSSTDIVCEVTTGATSFYLDNCIVRGTSFANLAKAELGIPNGYDCKIDFEGNLVPPCNAKTVPSDAKNVFEVQRKVVVTSNALTKAEFDSCVIGGACPLTDGAVTITVWKV